MIGNRHALYILAADNNELFMEIDERYELQPDGYIEYANTIECMSQEYRIDNSYDPFDSTELT